MMKAADLALLMTNQHDGRGGWVALAQFAQDWNRHPEARKWMKGDPLPEGTEPRRGALIAALVHSLCVRDRTTVPEWVLRWRHEPPVTVASGVGTGSPFGQSARARSPAVCDYHGAYFEVSFRDKP